MFLFRLFWRTILTNYHPKLLPEDTVIIDAVIEAWYLKYPIDEELSLSNSFIVDPENIFKYLLMPASTTHESSDEARLHQKCAAIAYDDNIIVVSFLSDQTISVYRVCDLTGYSNLDVQNISQSIII